MISAHIKELMDGKDVLEELEEQLEENGRRRQKLLFEKSGYDNIPRKERDDQWQERSNEIMSQADASWREESDVRENQKVIKQLRSRRKAASFAIWFHNGVNSLIRYLYHQVKPQKFDVPKEEARKRLDEFITARYHSPSNGTSLEEMLAANGTHYLPYETIAAAPELLLCQAALRYDGQGIIAQPEEGLADVVYRGNSLLYLHRMLREKRKSLEVKINRKKWDVELQDTYMGHLVPLEDLQEAQKRIPYYMDLTWVNAYSKGSFSIPVPALAVTFTLPQYNGLMFMEVRKKYKSREFYIEVLSHEMTHAGTVYLDTRREFIETKAYAVGKGSLIGEYAVAANSRPNILLRAVQSIIQTFLFIPVPDQIFAYLPKLKAAAQIYQTTDILKEVRSRLKTLYGEKGDYIAGRLTGDELEEFYYTNDIAGRIEQKHNIKWRIMKEKMWQW